MLKYKNRDSKVLTVLVGIAKIAADLGRPLGWAKDDPILDEDEHSSNQVWAVLEAFGCFAYTTPTSMILWRLNFMTVKASISLVFYAPSAIYPNIPRL